ncbi:MAG TPA: hypothetical protein VMI53_03350 [Opitutaceae bacterium]|nr:hypothetical protein [Opitutaceae bacterium]
MNQPDSPFSLARKFVPGPGRRATGLVLGLSLLSGCVVERPPPRRVYVEPGPPPPPAVVEEPAPPPGGVVIVREAPPPPRIEVIPARPGPRYVWCPGHWRYNGRYYWQPGHWERPPHEHAAWIAPHWELRGGGYVFIEGVWR